ncbi:Protein CBG14958 [Caenorhabditis briggsae]|uniref:non-specific serine/threonine protein kinase n=2 Tax=Caenorhabditis briggsae TaxID=6238 RepID=A8XL36_CAEBR|nr:Protein CBG14958 [Caenorhabditis briggsae]ULU10109.1 hypothetical protein L3Y34_014440 [Caenorhabditis briggsae]CAP33360.1 Protein CBG14958 [Caenorhabditis briggsae]
MTSNCENSSTSNAVKVMRPGHVIDKWRIKALLGKGACGVVYKVEDKNRKGYCAAMKVEYDSQEFDRTLQIEVHVLSKLKDAKDVLKIIDCGKRKHYTYMVTTLCGKDLMALRLKIQRGFNDVTALRVALFTLYGLKQLHETGFVHRDVKPGNIMTAANRGRDSRFLILIDFGMARSFVLTGEDGKKKLRPMRRRIPLRGTVRYCSMNVHERVEQGRCDDLIAMIYTIVFLTLGLPWSQLKDEKEIMSIKKSTKDVALFEDLPEELKTIFEYLKTLSYSDRPNYEKIYNLMMASINRLKINFMDPYEWEDEEIEKMAKIEREEKEKEEKEKEKEQKSDPMKTAKSSKPAETPIPGDVDEEKKLKGNDSDEQQNTSKVDKCSKLQSAKDLASSHSDANENSQIVNVSKSADPAPGNTNDMETAIDYDQSEYKTKKALPREDLQFVVFPAIAPHHFTEVIIPF